MKHILPIILTITAVLLLSTSCFRCKYEKNFESAIIPDTVKNLDFANTIYDDYNSSVPLIVNNNFPLVFSTNRYTKGGTYDLIDFQVYIEFDETEGSFEIFGGEYDYILNYLNPYGQLTDYSYSEENEFGPVSGVFGQSQYLFCFASDRTGNMEIFVTYWDDQTFHGVSMNDPTPFRLQGVNTPHYDAYPSFNQDFSKMILCSNRDDGLDFYTIEIPSTEREIQTWIRLTDTTFVATPVDELNSPGKDVCPYINGQLIVFASDREGGFGGYDLWYAKVEGDGFSEPVNFGPKINTAHDEYRPISILTSAFENDMLIFSSNRPGGKGGFDLYYTGIERMTIDY